MGLRFEPACESSWCPEFILSWHCEVPAFDIGVNEITDAEKFWYLLQCIAL